MAALLYISSPSPPIPSPHTSPSLPFPPAAGIPALLPAADGVASRPRWGMRHLAAAPLAGCLPSPPLRGTARVMACPRVGCATLRRPPSGFAGGVNPPLVAVVVGAPPAAAVVPFGCYPPRKSGRGLGCRISAALALPFFACHLPAIRLSLLVCTIMCEAATYIQKTPPTLNRSAIVSTF